MYLFKTKTDASPATQLMKASRLWFSGRVHFPKNRIGEIVQEDEAFVIFRQVVVDRGPYQPKKPGALLTVRFKFDRFPFGVNRRLSLIPIPFIIAQPGFRSKTWMLGKESGGFRGVYEWDTLDDAENYWTSFPMMLMKKRAAAGSLSHQITEAKKGNFRPLPIARFSE